MTALELVGLLEQLGRLPAEIRELRSEVEKLRALAERASPATLVAVPEAARALGISCATVRRRIRDGSLPVTRLGRAVRVDLARLKTRPDEVARLALEAQERAAGGRR